MSNVIEKTKTPGVEAINSGGFEQSRLHTDSILCSGYGQFHTDKTREINGRTYEGKPYVTISIEAIIEMAENPTAVPKAQAQWVIPSSRASRVHADQRDHGAFYFLWSDFDTVTDTIEETHQKARSVTGSDCLVYASRSATEDHQKARLIVPLSEPCDGETFVMLQRVLNDQLQAHGLTPDRATERAAQVCYLPNRGEFYAYKVNHDMGPLVWRDTFEQAIDAERQRERAALALREEKLEQARLKVMTRMQTGQTSPMDAFNEAYPPELLLSQYGYQEIRPGRWLSPNSESGAPGVVVKGSRWISSHGSDAHIGKPCEGGTSGDAFDLFVAYQHGGDSSAALRAAGELFTIDGVSVTKHNQRRYMQAHDFDTQPPEDIHTAHTSQSGEFVEYPTPQPIPDDLLPVEAFDDNLLPDSIRPWISDIAQRMQCPADFPAVAAMVALSSVIGRKACLQPKRFDDWQIMPNLWGMVVGRPGVKKSPALSQALAPLGRLSIAAKEDHDDAMREFSIDQQVNEMSSKAASKKAESAVKKGDIETAKKLLAQAADDDTDRAPTLRRYKVNDSTVEALGEILIENPNGLLAYRDELNGLLRNMDREGQEGARAFYLQGYDGDQSYTFDRIMRGRNLYIPAVCLAMLGGIQPGKLQSYINDAVRGGTGDDGLLQRFGLLVWPDIKGEWKNIDRWPDTPAKTAAFEVFQHLDRLEAGIDPDTEHPTPGVYRFTPEAQKIFDDWQHAHHNEMRSSERHEALASHYAKYEKLVGALALVCALSDGETEVSATSLARALAWSQYLRTHAERAYAAGIKPSSEPAKALLSKIRSGDVSDGFTARNVYLKGWSHLSTPEAVHAAAELLVDLNHLFEDRQGPGPTGGRPTVRYEINPATLRGL